MHIISSWTALLASWNLRTLSTLDLRAASLLQIFLIDSYVGKGEMMYAIHGLTLYLFKDRFESTVHDIFRACLMVMTGPSIEM